MSDVVAYASVRSILGIADAYDYELRLCFYPNVFEPYWRLHAHSPKCDSPYPKVIWSPRLNAWQAAKLQAKGIR